MIEELAEEASEKLTDWENSYIESIWNIIDNDMQLSMSQIQKLEDIYDKYIK